MNQIPSHKSKPSPYVTFKKKSIPLDFFQPLGTRTSFLSFPLHTHDKLASKADIGRLIGYNTYLLSYRILTSTGKIVDSKHVQFLDNIIDYNNEPLLLKTDLSNSNEVIKGSISHPYTPPAHVPPPQTPQLNCSQPITPESDHPVETPRYELRERTSAVRPVHHSHLITDPKTYREALRSDDKDLWGKAIDDEFESIENLNVWEDCFVPPKEHLHTTLVLKTKPAKLSSPEKKKARLCIQGFKQIPGIDFHETFTPTGKYLSLLALLTLAVDRSFKIRQFDVKGAFLYAPLKEDIFIKTPVGSKRTAPFLKLNKSLYGLKQAPANWFETLTSWLVSISYEPSESDPCLYIHHKKTSFVFFHVYNLVVAGKTETFEHLFITRFPNSSAHDPDTLLGMDVKIKHDCVLLSQKKLIKKGLDLLNLSHNNSVATPLTPAIQLTPASENNRILFSDLNINYRSYTGILNYLACRTRPDIAPAVSILSQFNQAPGIELWKQVIHCWKYLAGTIDLSLVFCPKKDSNSIFYFSDATWGDDPNSRKFWSGHIAFWKGCPISWNSCKQKNITMSSTEAELNALSDACQENCWLLHLIRELWQTTPEPTTFHIDNKGLLNKLNHFGSNSKTKHLEIKCKYIRDLLDQSLISVNLIPTKEMVADALTKPCNRESLELLNSKLFS